MNDAQAKALLGDQAWAMLTTAPTAQVLKGQILAKTGVLVPDGTPDILAYIKANYQPRGTYSFRASASETIRGTANFTATRLYSGNIKVDADTLIEIANESDDMDEFNEKLEEYLREQYGELNEEDTDYNYEDEECTDGDGTEDWEFENYNTLVDQFFAANPTLHPDYEEPQPEEEEDDTDDQDDDHDDSDSDEEA